MRHVNPISAAVADVARLLDPPGRSRWQRLRVGRADVAGATGEFGARPDEVGQGGGSGSSLGSVPHELNRTLGVALSRSGFEPRVSGS